jgi:hypothetical protein
MKTPQKFWVSKYFQNTIITFRNWLVHQYLSFPRPGYNSRNIADYKFASELHLIRLITMLQLTLVYTVKVSGPQQEWMIPAIDEILIYRQEERNHYHSWKEPILK